MLRHRLSVTRLHARVPIRTWRHCNIKPSAWLEEIRPNYTVVTSQLVVMEASAGDTDAVARRLNLLAEIPILGENPDMDRVADELLR